MWCRGFVTVAAVEAYFRTAASNHGVPTITAGVLTSKRNACTCTNASILLAGTLSRQHLETNPHVIVHFSTSEAKMENRDKTFSLDHHVPLSGCAGLHCRLSAGRS